MLDGKGELHERLSDLGCSDDRAINKKDLCDRPIGDTVDIEFPIRDFIGPNKSARWRPNVLATMLDDGGYSSTTSYGGIMRTPTFDRILYQE